MAKKKSKSVRRGAKKSASRTRAKKAGRKKGSAAEKTAGSVRKTTKKAPRKAAARKKAAHKTAHKTAKKTTAPRRKKSTTRKKAATRRAASAAKPVAKASRKQAASKKTASKKTASKKTASKKASRKKAPRKPAARPSSTPKPRTKRPRANTFRLSDAVIPLGYTLALDLDPARGLDYAGTLQIDVELTRDTRRIELHAADLKVRSAHVEYGFSSTLLEEEEDPGVLASAAGDSRQLDEPRDSEGAASPPADSSFESREEADESVVAEAAREHSAGSNGSSSRHSSPPSFTIGTGPSPIIDVPATPSAPVHFAAGHGEGAAVGRQSEPLAAPVPQASPMGSGTPESVPAPDSLATSLAAGPRDPDWPVEALDTDEDSTFEDPDPIRVTAKARANPDQQTVVLELAETVPAGVATLELEFEGKLREDLRGLYFARSGEHPFAFTQLEPVDARRFFPCFDEPALKAPLQISVRTHQDHTVLSNAPVETVHFEEDGRKTVHFQPTQPLPSYLYALAVGPLEGSESRFVGETEVRIWHAPGKAHLVDFGAECAAESLSRLETYFDIAYPYEKLDLVAVPDFEIGAMENAGAVFFRETLLLLDPHTATAEEKKRAAEVIAHELAHMWFGDLVTMRWWDDLWLKESFATWMSYKIIDQWQPEWRMWNRFLGDREDALELDSLQATHPVYTEVRSPSDATEHFDAITYEKGASVIRMVERYLGEDGFRDGVRLYLQRHAGGVAEAADLWDALSESSGQNIDRVVRAWIGQEGHPLIRLKRRRGDGNARLILTQERCVERPAPRSGKPAKVSGKWPVPWLGRVGAGEHGGSRFERSLLEKVRQEVELDTVDLHFVHGNGEAAGFWRVLYEREERDALLANREHLDALERQALVRDTWALVRSGQLELTDLLKLAETLADETDPDVLEALVGALSSIRHELVAEAGPRVVEVFERWLVDRFAPALIDLGWEAEEDEVKDTSLLRAQILSLLAEVAHWGPVQQELDSLFALYLDDPTAVDPDLGDLIVKHAAIAADAERYELLRTAYQTASTPQLAVRYLKALCACTDRKQIQATLQLCLDGGIATQDVARSFVWMLENPAARDAAWTFLSSKWNKVRKRLTPTLVSRVVDATPKLGSSKAKSAVRAHFKAHPVPTARQSLARAMERFDIAAALRRRAVPALQRWAKEQ